MRPPRLPGKRGSIPTPSGANDKVRLAFLVALMLVFVVGFLYLRFQAGEVPTASELDFVEESTPYEQIVREPAARIDFNLLAGVRDETRADRLVREPKPYTHLLDESRKLTPGDMEALGMRRADAAQILASPATHRGQAFEVKGTLETIDTVRGSSFQEIRGTLVDQDGQRYTFSVLREPDAEIGDVVRLQGFFFKRFAFEVAPGEYDDSTVYLVGRNLLRSYFQMPTDEDLSDAPLHLLRDYDLTDMVELQEEILYHLLNFVRHLTKEDRAQLEYADVSWADLRRDPDRYRGKPVRVFANFYPKLQWPRKLGPEGENPLEVDVFYDGIIKLPHDRLFRWIGFDPVDPTMLADSRLIHLEGIFYKNYAWENTHGDPLTAPLIVATGFTPFVVGRNELVEYMGIGIAVATILLLLIFFSVVFADGRKSAQFRQEYLRRKRRRMASAMEAQPNGEGSGSEGSKSEDVTTGA